MTPWLAASAPASTLLSGVLALIAAGLVVVITTLLGPDVRVLRCLDARGRTLAYVAAFWWFVRGVVLLTAADPHVARWDAVLSWGATVVLGGYVLRGVWAERMPPEVRERFDRREAARKARVRRLLEDGRPAEAKLAAEGEAVVTAAHELGLPPETIRALTDTTAPVLPD